MGVAIRAPSRCWRCCDHTSLRGGRLSAPPSIATKSDPQPSILTQDALREPWLSNQSVCFWSGWGNSGPRFAPRLPGCTGGKHHFLDRTRSGFRLTPRPALELWGWGKYLVISLIRQELPCDARHSAGDAQDGRAGFFACGAEALVEVAEIAVAADAHPRGLDKGPAKPFITVSHQLAVVRLAAAAAGDRAQSRVAAELLGADKTADVVDLADHHGGEDGTHAWDALHMGLPGCLAHHLFQRGFVLLDAQLHGGEHVELLPQQQPCGRGQLKLVEEAHALLAEDVAALRQLQAVLRSQQPVDAVA